MTKKQKKKAYKLQFGTPFEMPRSGGVQARISVDFKKVLNSWFNVGDLLPTRSSIDGDRLKNIIPTIFHRHQSEPSSRTFNTPPHTFKETDKRFYIDMNKLEEIETLNSKEKENIMHILNELKCDNVTENKQTNQHKEAKKRRKKRKSVVKKANNTLNKENKVKNTKCSYTKKKKTKSKVGNIRRSMSKISQCKECKQCSEMFEKTFKSQQRKQKQPPTTIASSAEKLLHSLITDRRAFGDMNNEPIEQTESDSSASINTIFRKGQNICIKNIELKYLKPTYVVQYNTTETSANNNSLEGPQLRERLYSRAAIDAHLGQTSAPDYHEGKPHPVKTSMHYKDSHLRIIGGGHDTEELLREQANSFKIEESNDKYVSDIVFPEPQGERVTKWQRDPIPSYLLPTEQRAGSVSLQTNEVKNEKEQKSRKCIQFVKKCLCLPTEKKYEQKELDKVESAMARTHKEGFLKIKKKSPPVNNNYNVDFTRVTEEDFFHEKESKTKNKKKKQKKRTEKKVSFKTTQ